VRAAQRAQSSRHRPPSLIHPSIDHMLPFTVTHRDSETAARAAELVTPHGTVHTPAFMPVGTYGTVKGMLPRDIRATGAEIILGNTFHLWLRPGTAIIEQHGDLHDFMGWDGPILTDSGGY